MAEKYCKKVVTAQKNPLHFYAICTTLPVILPSVESTAGIWREENHRATPSVEVFGYSGNIAESMVGWFVAIANDTNDVIATACGR